MAVAAGVDQVAPAGQWLEGLSATPAQVGSDLFGSPLQVALLALLVGLMLVEVRHLLGWWWDWQHRRRLRGAREILIQPPAEVDPDGVDLWWAQLAGLLRSRGWRRLVFGPAHIGFELRWEQRELTFVVWVPGTLSTRPLAAAARAAWPGATTTIRPARHPLFAATGDSPVSYAPAEGPPAGEEGLRAGQQPLLEGPPEGPPQGHRRADRRGERASRRTSSVSEGSGAGDAHTPDTPNAIKAAAQGKASREEDERRPGGRSPGQALLQRIFAWVLGGATALDEVSAPRQEPGPRRTDDGDVTASPIRAPAHTPAPWGSLEPVVPQGYEVFEAGRALIATLPGWYTFSSRTDHRVDPLRAVIEQGATLKADQSACVQILVRSPSSALVHRTRAGAAGLKTGQGTRGAQGGIGLSGLVANGTLGLVVAAVRTGVDIVLDVLDAVLSGVLGGRSRSGGGRSTSSTASTAGRNGRAGQGAQRGVNPLQDQDARPGLDKVRTGLLWQVSVRIAVTHLARMGDPPASAGGRLSAAERERRRTEQQRRELIVANLHAHAHALATALGVHDDRNGLRSRGLRAPGRVLAERRLEGPPWADRRSRVGSFVLGSAELASLAALPTDVAVPGLDRAQSRTMPAPTGLSAGGREVKVLGRATADGRAVGLSMVDARQHVHVLGSTGVGKSTLLCRQILADINAGRGVVVIDPKGDLALDVLDRMPAHAVARVTLIDPDQPLGSAGFNPLAPIRGVDSGLQVDNLTAIFASIFSRHWGPRIDDVLRVACLTLMRYPGARLTMVPALLNNKKFRAPMTVDLTDAAGLGGFWEWYESTPAALRAQVIGPVLARLRSFLLRDFVRYTIGREHSTFDMNQILDGGILIARIPKGQLGEDASKLMGSMLLASVWQAATARAGIPEDRRRDAVVYTDEAHNILNLSASVTDMLAEARGYHLSFVLAHQNLDQMPREVQQALSANARNKIYFSCSPEDAHQLSRHTLPELDERDLSNLGPYRAAARLVAGNREMRAFTLSTTPMPASDPHARRKVRDHVRRTGPEDLPADTDASPEGPAEPGILRPDPDGATAAPRDGAPGTTPAATPASTLGPGPAATTTYRPPASKRNAQAATTSRNRSATGRTSGKPGGPRPHTAGRGQGDLPGDTSGPSTDSRASNRRGHSGTSTGRGDGR